MADSLEYREALRKTGELFGQVERHLSTQGSQQSLRELVIDGSIPIGRVHFVQEALRSEGIEILVEPGPQIGREATLHFLRRSGPRH